MPLSQTQKQVVQDIARANIGVGDASLSRKITNGDFNASFHKAGAFTIGDVDYYKVLNVVRRERGTNRYGKSEREKAVA